MAKIPVGVSQCLLGESVRFDGSHKHNHYITDVLGEFLDFHPICPEVAIGLGVPRKPIRLMAHTGQNRVQGIEDPSLDVTGSLTEHADIVANQHPDLCGYLFMQRSPSCGVFSVKRYGSQGNVLDNKGRGLYAKRLMELMPLLPVEEAGRLNDLGLRDNFLTRVFALHDWKTSVASAPSAKKLIDFYSRYKYQVMAHHVPSYFAIGKRLANLAAQDINASCSEFLPLFMGALAHPATRSGNTNAMMHLRGYLKKILDTRDKQELSRLIESYQAGWVPIVVPLTLLKHHLVKLGNPYLSAQTFWEPYPEKLTVRNYVSNEV